MTKITVVNRAGDARTVEAGEGLTVMEVIRDNEFDELLALCGGCCSCATCHVMIEDNFMAKTGQISEDEDDLLDSSDHRQPNSRLSCQITVTPELDGMRVTIAPED